MNSISRARVVFSSMLFFVLLLGAFASSFAANISPLTFGNDATDDAVWKRLVKYKLWATGTNGDNASISFDTDATIKDSIGYTGSAHGGLTFLNDKHVIGGALLFKGGFVNSTGSDNFLTGPVHFGGYVNVNQNGANQNEFHGDYCLEGGSSNDFGRARVKPNNVSNCNGVPAIDTDLDVPNLVSSPKYDLTINGIHMPLGGASYIDVPPAKDHDEPYVIHIRGDINLENQASLYVRMPYGGRLTKIILDGSIKITNNSNIQAIYAQASDTWREQTMSWPRTYEHAATVTEYTGNLLFYTPNNIDIPSGPKIVQGTYISKGQIKIAQHMNFAGQMIAKKLIIEHHFNSEFRYVPFGGASVDTKAIAKGQLTEGNGPEQITFSLTEPAAVKVSFDYCYSFEDDAKENTLKSDRDGVETPAHRNDVQDEDIPLCKDNKHKTAHFQEDAIYSTEKEMLTAFDDDLTENKEYFYLYIYNVTGAVLDNGAQSGTIKIYINDNDDKAVGGDTTIYTIVDGKDSIGYEDVEFAIKAFPAFTSSDGKTKGARLTEYKVKIVSLPAKGSLKIRGTAAKAGDIITSADLLKDQLTYVSDENDYGDSAKSYAYSSFSFLIMNKNNVEALDAKTMSIQMTPVNDAPNIVSLVGNYVVDGTFQFEEDFAVGTMVGGVHATDVDKVLDTAATLTYSFGKMTPAAGYEDITKAFTINAVTGNVYIADSLSYNLKASKYQGIVVVTDNGVPGNRKGILRDTLVLNIELIEVRHPPKIDNNPNKDTVIVLEHSAKNTIVMEYKASDENKGDALNLSYELKSVSGSAMPFIIDSVGADTAVVYVTETLDYETMGTIYKMMVVVSDNRDASIAMYDTSYLTILVKDVNEAPIVDKSYAFLAGDWNKYPDSIGQIVAYDLDTLATPKTTLTYSMTNIYDVTDPSNKTDASGLFAIDSKTGKVYVKQTDALGTSLQKHEFEAEVTVTDNGSAQSFCAAGSFACSTGTSLSSKTKVTISIPEKNYPPDFDSSSYAFTVKENSVAGTIVGGVSATDSNSAQTLVFTLSDNTLPFEIVSSGKDSATIKVKKNAKIDYEADSTYTFKVYVSDGALKDTADVTIKVEDVNEAPKIVTTRDFFVKENSTVGTVVDTVKVTDPDIWTSMSYALADSTKDAAKFFNIAPAASCETGYYCGVITVKVDTLDYEKNALYIIKITATDNGVSHGLPPDMSDTKTFKIHVTDENDKPEFDSASYTFNVDENSAAFTVVGQVHATDQDFTTNLTYTMVKISSGADTLFEMDAATGEITVKDGANLDYEKVAKYELTAYVTDDGDPAKCDTAKVTININNVNEDPTIDATKGLAVDEWAAIGTVIGNVTDGDLDTNAAFMKHKFFAIGGDTLLFAIDSMTGAVSVKDTIFDVNDAITYYTLDVRVVDYSTATLLYAHGEIEITLNHVNDPPKMTTDRFYVVENSPEGTFVGDLDALVTDDVTSFADLKFSIVSVSDEFDISVNYNGQITVKAGADIDYEKRKSYTVTVRATDVEGAYSEADYIVIVKNINEAPTIRDTTFTIAENSKGGTIVGKLTGYDPEDGNNVDFTLDSGFVSNEFEISSTGVVRVKSGAVLDYETQTEYTLKVKVTDKEGLSSTGEVAIYVTDENEPPAFEKNDFHVSENASEKTVVGKLVAHDAEDPDSVLIYALVGSSMEFEVSRKGEITVKKGANLDYETKHEYTIKVSVTDLDGASAEGTAVIHIDDVREPPSLNDTTFHVEENVPKGSLVGVLVPNNPEKDTLKYKLLTNTDKFKIRDNGSIVTVGTIDYEEQKNYKLKVVLIGDDGSLDTANVTIVVDNVVETPTVKIIRAEDGDSIWVKPDTIYTNKHDIDFEWTVNDKIRPDTLVTFPKDSTYIFSLCYDDPTMDFPGCDTVVVKIDNSLPKVKISKSAEDTAEVTGVTIVEQVDDKDTNFYVNHEDNVIRIHVTDKATGVDSSFKIKLRLDSLASTKKSLDKIKKISKTEITLDDAENAQTKRVMINNEKYEVSFRKLVGDDTVTVVYYTDKKGKAIKNSDGDVIMKVSYDTEVEGKTTTVSYNVNGRTGEIVENGNGGVYEYNYTYVDEFGGIVGVRYSLDEKGKFAKTDAGDLGYEVSYSYKNRYGNTGTKNIIVVVDKIVPVVKILSPEDKLIVHTSGVDVKWTVDGEIQDTLVVQALKEGLNRVIRTYRDKAGNEASDTVNVFLRSSKQLDVHVEKAVTLVNEDSVHKYYDLNPPKKGQSYAVSMYDPYKDQEIETLIGGTFGKKTGSKKETYPGMDGHLGPTLLFDALAPRCGDKTAGGLCTLDDLIERDGKISLEAGGGWDRKKVSVEEYVDKYCNADFRKDYKKGNKEVNIYNTSLHVTIWIYTNLGGFLDKYSFTQDVNDPNYVNEVGEVSMAFEMKPDMDGNVLASNGRLLGTGAYIFNTEVKSVSELRCKLPDEEIGHKRYVTDALRKSFGYRRPNTNKNDATKSTSGSKSKSSSKKK